MTKQEKLSAIVVRTWVEMFGDDIPESEILGTDPNIFDIDPCGFYETMDIVLGLDFNSFGPTQLGESLAESILRVVPLWDGVTENDPDSMYIGEYEPDED